MIYFDSSRWPSVELLHHRYHMDEIFILKKLHWHLKDKTKQEEKDTRESFVQYTERWDQLTCFRGDNIGRLNPGTEGRSEKV